MWLPNSYYSNFERDSTLQSLQFQTLLFEPMSLMGKAVKSCRHSCQWSQWHHIEELWFLGKRVNYFIKSMFLLETEETKVPYICLSHCLWRALLLPLNYHQSPGKYYFKFPHYLYEKIVGWTFSEFYEVWQLSSCRPRPWTQWPGSLSFPLLSAMSLLLKKESGEVAQPKWFAPFFSKVNVEITPKLITEFKPFFMWFSLAV